MRSCVSAPWCAAVIVACASTSIFAQESGRPAALSSDGDVEYLLSGDRLFEVPDNLVPWDGFITGLRGFERFYEPISNIIYHESPTIETNLKVFYLYHGFPEDNVIDGGHLDIIAGQARLALTDRIAFIATKDGYTWFDPGFFDEPESGWNDFQLGLKGAVIADEENDFLLTVGARYLWRSGSQRILQGTYREVSPFVSVGKGYGKLNLLANATYRIGIEDDETNDIFQWSLHADYPIAMGIAPVIELNGLHYLNNGERTPLNVGGLDYTNLGSTSVEGDTVVWVGTGAAVKLNPNVELGATFELPLTEADDDIMDERVTVHLTFSF